MVQSDRVSRAGQEFASANLRGDEDRPDVAGLSFLSTLFCLVVGYLSARRVMLMLVLLVPQDCSKRVNLLGSFQTDVETQDVLFMLSDALDQQWESFSNNRFVLHFFS